MEEEREGGREGDGFGCREGKHLMVYYFVYLLFQVLLSQVLWVWVLVCCAAINVVSWGTA